MDARERRRERRIELLVALVVLAATVFFVQPVAAQSASRLALTAAVTERGTVVIDDYEATLGADYAEKDGHLYSDKAPGQPLAAVPFWAVYRAVGGEPGTELRVEGNLGAWWLTLWFAAIPAALLAVSMRRYARRLTDATGATTVALAMALGTMLLPFGTLLFGHVLSALLVFEAFRRIHSADEDAVDARRQLFLAGLLVGGAVAVEYTVAIVGLVLTAVVLSQRPKLVGWYVLGGALPAAALAAYHQVAFGGPLEHAYKYSVFDLHHDTFAGIGTPDAGTLGAVLVGDRGLLTLTPVVAVAIAGLVLARRTRSTVDVAVPATVLGAYLVFSAGWIDPTGGFSPGPRHVIPALPFLVVGLVAAYERWRPVVIAAAAIGAATMGLATIGDPQLPTNARPALRLWAERFADGDGARTVLSPVLGRGGLVVGLGLIVVVAWFLVQAHRPHESQLSSPPRHRVGGP